MKPVLFNEWNLVLTGMTKANELLTVGRLKDAGKYATTSLLFASHAIHQLGEELSNPFLSFIASNLFYEVIEKTKKRHTPKELMEWARTTLERIHSELPPDTFQL